VLARLWCPVEFWCQSISGASGFLMPARLWCQHISGASPALVPSEFWYQPGSGASPFLMPVHFWYQHISGACLSLVVSAVLVSAGFWCQPISVVGIALCSRSSGFRNVVLVYWGPVNYTIQVSSPHASFRTMSYTFRYTFSYRSKTFSAAL
jgi:hypothetical protein